MSQIEMTTGEVIGVCHGIIVDLINYGALEVSELAAFRDALHMVGEEANIRNDDAADKVCKVIGEIFDTLACCVDDELGYYSKLVKEAKATANR